MNRRPLAWLVAVPLMTAGSLTAHALAYRIVEPDSATRGDLLAKSGHGYLASAPLLLRAARNALSEINGEEAPFPSD